MACTNDLVEYLRELGSIIQNETEKQIPDLDLIEIASAAILDMTCMTAVHAAERGETQKYIDSLRTTGEIKKHKPSLNGSISQIAQRLRIAEKALKTHAELRERLSKFEASADEDLIKEKWEKEFREWQNLYSTNKG